MPITTAIVVFSLALYAGVVLLAVLWSLHRRGRERASVADRPPVTILKPMKGVDEDLEANLESFASLSWPDLQILLAIADPHDPAVEVARRVQKRHPGKDIQVLVGQETIGRNPKVNLLHTMMAHARHDLLLISDSNVRATQAYLEATVLPMRDPEVGLVSNPVVGVDEAGFAAAMENLHLTGFIASVNIAAKVLARIDTPVGKSMLLRRQALEAMGSFRAVRNVLAEDNLIGVKLREAGWKVALAGHPVFNVNRRWSLRRLVERHARWARLRVWLAPWSYPLEVLGNPVALAAIFALFGAPGGLGLLGMTAAVKAVVDAVACRGLRGHFPRLRHLLASPLKDLVVFGIWFVPFWSMEVDWRGNRLKLARGTGLVRPEALARAKRIARTARPEPKPADRSFDLAA